MPATLTTFQFEIPASVANMGVQLGLFGNAPTSQGQKTTQEYLAPSSPGSYSYQNVPTSGKLPLITLSSASTTNTLPIAVSIPIPAQPLVAGAAVLFVGQNEGLAIQTNAGYNTGLTSVPTTVTNPNDVFSLFELTNIEPSTGQYSLDVDISEVDQLGFTYTVTSSNAAPYPLASVGTPPTRSTFFTQFNNAFSSQNTEFLESSQLGRNSNGQQLRLVAPQTVLGTFESAGPIFTSVGAQGTGGNGGLAAGTAYYYVITAKSSTGETMAGANQDYPGGIVNDTSSVVLKWQPYTGIQDASSQTNTFISGSSQTTGYNIYRGVGQTPDGNGAHPPPLTGYQLITSVSGANTTTFTDPGLTPTTQTPPSNSYGFDPLGTYFTPAINAFFTEFATTNFVYTQSPQAGGYADTKFTGTVKTIVPDWEPAGANLPYTVLQLTGSGGEFDGVTFNIYDPIFTTNTNVSGLSPMPSWLTAVTAATETPSQMVFGCDGVFATNSVDPDVQNIGMTHPNVPVADAQKSIGNIENVIVSAFNRGLATLSPTFQPNQWVNPLQFTSDPVAGSGGALAPSQAYYYEITSVETSGGETVPTREVMVALGADQSSVTLNWAAVDPSIVSSFHIYRATSSGQETLVATVPNITPPPTSFVDNGGQTPSKITPPYQFYSAGSTSNLYAAFLHQNSTTNPTTGISINGLVYGFPFDDQGNFSTNIQYPTGNLPTTVTFALNVFSAGLGIDNPAPVIETAGVPFSLSFSGQTGETIFFSSTDPRAGLPAAYTFVASDNGSHQFPFTLVQAGVTTVTVTSAGNSSMQSTAVNVLPAAAARISFGPVPKSVFVKTGFAISVQVFDAFGNAVPDASGIITLTSPGLAAPLRATIQGGVATFNPAIKKAGVYVLTASSPFGTATSSVISVSNATYFAVNTSKFVAAGRPLQIIVLARKRFGILDRNYQGTVDAYVGNQLVGTGVAVNGVARFTVDLPANVSQEVLVVRDSIKRSVAGRKFLRVTHAHRSVARIKHKL